MARSKGVPVSGTGIGGTAKEGSVGQAWRGFLRGTADVQDPAKGHVDTQVKAPGAGGTAGPGEGGLAVLARTLMRACLRARPRPPLLPPRASPWGRHRCSGLGPSLTICAWCFQAASAHTGLPSSSHLPALCPPQASSPVELLGGRHPKLARPGPQERSRHTSRPITDLIQSLPSATDSAPSLGPSATCLILAAAAPAPTAPSLASRPPRISSSSPAFPRNHPSQRWVIVYVNLTAPVVARIKHYFRMCPGKVFPGEISI